MPHPNSHLSEQFWRHRAHLLALKLNFHHWLARAVPILSALLAVVALFEIFRRETAQPARWSAAFLIFGSAVALGWAWFHARKHFCTDTQALVRLETVLHMHNRLSSAVDGAISWPAPKETMDDGYSLNWRKILAPLLAGILFLLTAHLIPVSRLKLGIGEGAISQPPEFTQVQNWINSLKAEDLIEPAKLQEMQSALDKLRQRPPQDWYTQSNLEAASSLKELSEQSMNALAQDLDQADQAVQAIKDKTESPGSPGNLEAMQDKLHKAGENLASGNLPLKQELVDQLRGGEAASDKPLTAAQLQQLHELLEKGKLATATACKSGVGKFSDEMQEAMALAAMSQGKGLGHRKVLRGAPGGAGGGESSAPLELQPRDTITSAGKLTGVSNTDMSHASLAETLKVTASEHNIDSSTYHGTQDAGAAPVTGNGGEAVWRSTYDPQEANTLTQFFK